MNHIGFKDINPPNIVQQVTNLARELPTMIKNGFKRVPDDIFEQRMQMCRTCFYWDEKGNLGFGKCKHPKCGCSKAKHLLEISSCPMGNWGKYKGEL